MLVAARASQHSRVFHQSLNLKESLYRSLSLHGKVQGTYNWSLGQSKLQWERLLTSSIFSLTARSRIWNQTASIDAILSRAFQGLL